MKNKFTFFLLLLALTQAIACQKQSLLTDVDSIENQVTLDGKSNLNNENKENTLWFSFEPIINSPEWINSEDIDWRLSQIQIPKEQLSIMPTSVLLNLCLDYPFYLDYTAANDCSDGFDRLMNTFNGFKELTKRNDALPLIASYLNSIDIPSIVKNAKNATRQRDNILHINFVELLTSRIASSQKYCKCNPTIEATVQKILAEKIRHRDVFSSFSLYSSKELEKSLSLKSEYEPAIIINTRYNRPVEALLRNELTYEEQESTNSYYISHYHNAEYLSSSSKRYNCHSFAWNISEGGRICWINGSLIAQPTLDGTVASYSDNVEAFWSDGLYSRTTSNKAEKIYYYRGDHSAIQSDVSGKYESKWGSGPLMRHSPTYCPSIYHPEYRRYFKKTDLILYCSVGDREVYVNESCTYSAIDIPDGISNTYHWDVVNNKNQESALGTYASIKNATPQSAIVTFKKAGIYDIRLYRSHPDRGQMVYEWEAYVSN
ncbi:MAG: hypothetical protein K5984_04935 [Bacteroidales bacterium]|nr:hypothetical protein [Bacteroidales bacterium]